MNTGNWQSYKFILISFHLFSSLVSFKNCIPNTIEVQNLIPINSS